MGWGMVKTLQKSGKRTERGKKRGVEKIKVVDVGGLHKAQT